MKKLQVEDSFLKRIKKERERFEGKLITQRLTKAMLSSSNDFLKVFKEMESRFKPIEKEEYFCMHCNREVRKSHIMDTDHFVTIIE